MKPSERFKPSERLKKINANLSARTDIFKTPLTLEDQKNMNGELAEIIKQVRELEKMTKDLTIKEIWNESTIRKETEDHYGRMGRGITICYLDPKLKNKKYISEEEYIKKVLEFETKILKQKINEYGSLISGLPSDKINYILKLHKEIFGDFENG